MTIDEMIEAIAADAYEGATEDDLRFVFTEQVTANLRGLSDAEIEDIYAEVIGA